MNICRHHPKKIFSLLALLIGVTLAFLVAGQAAGQAEFPPAGEGDPNATPAPPPLPTPQPVTVFQVVFRPDIPAHVHQEALAYLNVHYHVEPVPGTDMAVRVTAPTGAETMLRALPGVDLVDEVNRAAAMVPASIMANGAITGVVTADEGGLPLENCSVCAHKSNPYVFICENTDATGVYTISVPAGSYKVTFYPQGDYIAEHYDDVSLEYSNDYTPVSVTDDTITPDINAGLALGVHVTGRVTEADSGDPLQSAYVNVAGIENDYYYVDAYTDADGVYTTSSGLPAGTYRVYFGAPSSDYAPLYYDGAHSPAQATPLEITTTHRTGINAALVRSATISGTVTGNGPLENITIRAYYGDSETQHTSTTTDNQGAYLLTGLAPTTYKLQFLDYSDEYLDEWYHDKEDWETADPIALTSSVTTTVDEQLARARVINGTVTEENTGLPLENIVVAVYDAHAGGYISGDTTDVSGTYHIGGLSAWDYKVIYLDYNNYYMTEYFDNKPTSQLADIVSLASEMTRTLNVELTVGASIAGRIVDDANDTGIAGVNVYVTRMDENPTNWSAVSDAQGYYAKGGLRTGVYQVRFQPPKPYYDTYYDNVHTIDAFTPVSATAGITTSGIDARLKRGYLITGTVSGPPALGGISVSAYYGSDHYSNAHGDTHSDGTYEVGPLIPGPYRVLFHPSNQYAPEWYDDASWYHDAQIIQVTRTVSNVDAHLETGGRITGTIVGTGGTPLPNVIVFIYPVGQKSLCTVTASNAQGQYATGPELPTGEYQVQFNAPFDYTAQWYSNTTSRATAMPVAVTAGSTTPNIDAVLESYDHGAITGTITAADTGLPLIAYVYAYNDDDEQKGYIYANNGEYTLTGLPVGAYRLAFRSPPPPYVEAYYHDQSNLASADRVTVTANVTVTGINQALQRGGSITGTVSAAGGIPGVLVKVNCTTGDHFEKTIYTAVDGSYHVDSLPACGYRVRFTPQSPYPEVWYNGAANDTEADLVTVTLGTTVPNINATLSASGVITGIVTADDSGDPMPNVKIYVYAPDGTPFQTANYTDADGHYQTLGLPAGNYYLYFDCTDWRFYRPEWYDQAFGMSQAISVSVPASGVVPNINATLERGGSISGWAYDAQTGYTLPGTYVNLYNAISHSYLANQYANLWGYYQVTGLADGIYKLQAGNKLYFTQWYSGATDITTAMSVTVTSPDDTPNINFYFPEPQCVYLPLILRDAP